MLRIFFTFNLIFLFIACDSDDETTPEVEVENFYGLTVGNSYSYSYHRRVSDTEEFETLALTSNVVITDEVIINGKSYFEFTKTVTGDDTFPGEEQGVTITTVRDVDGILQNEEGTVLFSTVVGSDPYLILDDDWGDVYIENTNQKQEKTVPAGIFNCDTNIRYAILEGGDQSPATDTYLFADGIGEIYSTVSTVNNPQHFWEKRLTSYSIEE